MLGLPFVPSQGRADWTLAGGWLAAWRSAGLALIGLLALVSPVLGSLHPALNWDVLPYVAIAKSWSGRPPTDLRRAAYADVEAFADARGLQPVFRQLTGPDAYRQTVAAGSPAFLQQLPFYRVRPLYEAAVVLVSQFTATATAATLAVAFLATLATNLIFAGVAVRRFGVGRALPAVALFAVSPFVTTVAHLSTPDALLAAFVAAAMMLLAEARDVAAAAVLFCAVMVRSDAVLLAVVLAAVLGLGMVLRVQPSGGRPVAAVAILCASVGAERLVELQAGNYGYSILYRFTFLGRTPYPAAMPRTLPSLRTMAHFFLQGVHSGLVDAGGLWAIAGMMLLLASCLRGNWLSRPGLLLAAVALWITARFVLFPSDDTRFLTPNFVALSVLLVAYWPAGNGEHVGRPIAFVRSGGAPG